MNWYYSAPEPEILWIKDLNQLNEKYPYRQIGKKFVFARYEVVDITHDHKLVKATASLKKAEEKKAKQLSYKKHADCEVIIRENDLQSKLDLDLSNVYGTDAYNKKFNAIRDYDDLINRDVVVVDRNINMVLRFIKAKLDKFIITKGEKQMRLTILVVEDRNNSQTTVTLFDNDIVDKLSENQLIKITNAEVNMRKFPNSEYAVPEGLKIPSWGSIEPTTGLFSDGDGLLKRVTFEGSSKKETVRCEQINCSGHGQDTQFYCAKCDMELCSICIFEHRKDTSISGLECDLEICNGSRVENLGVVQN